MAHQYRLPAGAMFTPDELTELQNKLTCNQLTRSEATSALCRAAQVVYFVTQNYGGPELRKYKLRFSCTWALPPEYEPVMDLWVKLLDQFLIGRDEQLDRQIVLALKNVDRLPFHVAPGEMDNFGWVTGLVFIKNVYWVI